MRSILVFTLALTMAITVALTAQAAPDFSGTWVLDLTKSDLDTTNAAAKKVQMNKVTLILKQTATQLSIERSTGDTAVYNLDGSESINNLPNGSQATTKMQWDGETLVAKTTSNIGGQDVAMTDVRSLDGSGQVMTLQVSRETPRGVVNQTLVYNKQQ